MRTSRSQKPYLVLSTVSSPGEAKKIANELLRKKLAACVNIVPQVDSLFRWRGAINHARELLLAIKTEGRQLKHLEKAIRKIHSYEVPEMIGIPIRWGHKPYLKWLRNSIS